MTLKTRFDITLSHSSHEGKEGKKGRGGEGRPKSTKKATEGNILVCP